MPETVLLIPRILSADAENQLELRLEGETVEQVLDQLRRCHPKLYRNVCNERGEVRQHINLFLNNDILDCRSTLDIAIQPGDVVSVYQAVSGG